jgi:thymidylate kinase
MEHLLSSGERDFFRKLLQRWEQEKTVPIFLRNYDAFPESIGNDLDLFFAPSEWQRAWDVFLTGVSAAQGNLLHIHERGYVRAVWFTLPDSEKPLHLDFYFGAYTWHGLEFLDRNLLRSEALIKKGLHVPRPAHEAWGLVMNSLLWGSFYKKAYHDRLVFLLSDPMEKAEYAKLAHNLLGTKSLDPSGLSGMDALEIKGLAALARKKLWARSWKASPLQTGINWLSHWWSEGAVYLNAPGLMVAFLGPDGSGKSTIIERIQREKGWIFGEVSSYHWRPSLLPDIGVLLGKRSGKEKGVVTDPHGQAPHSPVISFLRLFYYWIDYWLGWLLSVWRQKGKNHFILFDRYSWDMWVDPRRYRLQLPQKILSLAAVLTPQPGLLFVLDAPAKILQSRKQEVSAEEINRQRMEYRRIAETHPNARLIDCNRPVEEILSEVKKWVMEEAQGKLHAKWQGKKCKGVF